MKFSGRTRLLLGAWAVWTAAVSLLLTPLVWEDHSGRIGDGSIFSPANGYSDILWQEFFVRLVLGLFVIQGLILAIFPEKEVVQWMRDKWRYVASRLRLLLARLG